MRDARDDGSARVGEVQEWRAWLRDELGPRLRRTADLEQVDPGLEMSMCVRSEAEGRYDVYVETVAAGKARPAPFIGSPTRDVLDERKRLEPGVRLKVRFPVVGWVDAEPSDDRTEAHVQSTDTRGRTIVVQTKCKLKTYGETWVAVSDAPAVGTTVRIPFLARPTREAGRLWAVRHGSAGWVLARMTRSEDGVSLRQVGAPRWRLEEFGTYGQDHGEIEVWREGEDILPVRSHVLVRHPVLAGEWIPARRENNRWWVDYGTEPEPVLLRDKTIGATESMGDTWRMCA